MTKTELIETIQSLQAAASQPSPPSRANCEEPKEALRKSEALNQDILSSLTAEIVVLGKDGKIIAVNEAWKRFAQGNAWEDLSTGLDGDYLDVCRGAFLENDGKVQEARAGIQSVLNSSQPSFTLEYPCHSPQEERCFLMTVTPLAGEQGGAVISHTNITQRKQTEKAFCESEEKYRTLFESIDQGFCTIEVLFDENERPVDYRFLITNPAFEQQTGIQNAVGRRMREIAPLHEEYWFETYGRIALTGEPKRFESSAEQLHRIYDVYAWRVNEPAERKVAILFNDITERKRTEAALRGSEARMGGIINSAMDAIISTDGQQRILLFNRAAEKMFGYSSEEVLGQSLARFIPAKFRDAHEAHIRCFGATGETTRAMGALNAVSGVRHNGEEFPIEASISQIEAGGQKLFTVILRDITERVLASERLIEQAALLDQSHEAIIVRDLDGCIRYWGRGAERLYGWTAEEVIGSPSENLQYRNNPLQLVEATRLTIENGTWNGELCHLTKDGRQVIVEGHWTLVRNAEGKPKSILAINTDITEKKKLEAQYLRAQRLKSIGTLASGIAHDLNNILSPIMMGAQMLQMKLHDDQSQRLLGLMQSNANRCAEMIKQVLSFAKGISGQRVVLQSKHLIREIIRIAEETFPKSVRIKQQLPDDLWTTNADATQLHQVLLNLCVNARDAMPYGGTLTVEAENRLLDELYAQMLKGATAGNFVVITIADTGMGISPEIIDRIFDPFFTTKEPGQGTGLGLATVQGIVASHGGFITVESKPGIGTKFSIYLPSNEIASQQRTVESDLEMPQGAGELILVVDDEAAVREMTSAALEAFGGRLWLAVSGGASFDAGVARDFHRLGFTILQGYGLTETAAAATATRFEDNVVGSVGTPLKDVEVKIDEPDGAGVGEILIRGPIVMPGYYHNPEANREAFTPDGWFRSGDLGRFGERGHLFIVGRKKDIIKLPSGKNVFPEDVEAFYERSPFVSEICVLGIRDESSSFARAEKLVAVVVPNFDQLKAKHLTNAREWVSWELDNLGRELPEYQRVRDYIIRSEPLPRTTTRKVKRFEVKQWLESSGADTGQTRDMRRFVLSDADRAQLDSPAGKLIVSVTVLFLPPETSRERGWIPNVDVYRSSCGWLIKLDMAGVRQDDLCIELSGTKLMVSGFRRDWVMNEDWSHYSMEIAYSRFERVIELPCLEEQTKINADLREGMLLIYLTPEGEGRSAILIRKLFEPISLRSLLNYDRVLFLDPQSLPWPSALPAYSFPDKGEIQ